MMPLLSVLGYGMGVLPEIVFRGLHRIGQGGMNLEGTYAVTLNGEKVGTATMVRRGLYYEVVCRCNYSGGNMLRLLADINHSVENFGILIPTDGRLELKKLVSAKRMGEVTPVFYLKDQQIHAVDFLPVCSAAPFPHLHRLNECVFAVRNGKPGVEVPSENSAEKLKI